MNLASVIVEDDAEDELSAILEKARKVKQKEIKVEKDPDSVAKKVCIFCYFQKFRHFPGGRNDLQTRREDGGG